MKKFMIEKKKLKVGKNRDRSLELTSLKKNSE